MQDRTPRAALEPSFRKGSWYARGSVPIREGSRIARKRIERSAGKACKSKAQAQDFCDQLNRMFEQRAINGQRTLTFARAMSNYLDIGKPEPKFAEKIVRLLGTKLCSEIDNTDMIATRKAMFRGGRQGALYQPAPLYAGDRDPAAGLAGQGLRAAVIRATAGL